MMEDERRTERQTMIAVKGTCGRGSDSPMGEAGGAVSSGRARGKHVLVVSDDETTRGAFRSALATAGCRACVLASGEEALAELQRGLHDLVFLDAKVGHLDDVTMLRELRKLGGDTPVFFITTFRREALDRLEAAREDGLDFEVVGKPLDHERIVQVTEGALAGPCAF